MKCPTCGAWTEVKETRRQQDSMSKRTRVCANSHTFQTIEAPIRQGITLSELAEVCAILVAPTNAYVFEKKLVMVTFIRKE